MRNQNGFSLVILIGLLPLFITITLALYYLASWLQPNERAMQICRSGLLNAELNSKKNINALIELNKTVITLRRARLIAEKSLQLALATADPPAIVTAEMVLNSVITAQGVTHAQQSYLIFQGNRALLIGLTEARRQIQNEIYQFKEKFQSYNQLEGTVNPSLPSRLAVRKIESTDPGPPTYEIDNEIMKKQALHISWKLSENLLKGIKQWNQQGLEKSTSCTASLEYKDNKLDPVLIRDRFSLSSFF